MCCRLQPHVLQAGVSLGLTDKIVAKFPLWGHKLQAAQQGRPCCRPPPLLLGGARGRPLAPSQGAAGGSGRLDTPGS